MKVICIIDNIGSGGAQRQLVNLAIGLSKISVEVDFFYYNNYSDFYLVDLKSSEVKVLTIPDRNLSHSKTLFNLISILNKGGYDAIVAFMFAPALLSSVAKLFSFRCSTKLIISERSYYKDETRTIKPFFARIFYLFSDYIICNSFSQKEWLCNSYPLYNKKVGVIYNGVKDFHCDFNLVNSFFSKTLIGVGRISPEKNIETIMFSIVKFYNTYGWAPKFNWVGSLNESADKIYLKKLIQIINTNPCLKKYWNWLDQRNDIYNLISQSDALVLASHYEGFANVVCESFCAAKPVIISNVCDHSRIVVNGSNGFLFESDSFCQLAERINSLYSSSVPEYFQLRIKAYETFKSHFTIERMVEEYFKIIYK